MLSNAAEFSVCQKRSAFWSCFGLSTLVSAFVTSWWDTSGPSMSRLSLSSLCVSFSVVAAEFLIQFGWGGMIRLLSSLRGAVLVLWYCGQCLIVFRITRARVANESADMLRGFVLKGRMAPMLCSAVALIQLPGDGMMFGSSRFSRSSNVVGGIRSWAMYVNVETASMLYIWIDVERPRLYARISVTRSLYLFVGFAQELWYPSGPT